MHSTTTLPLTIAAPVRRKRILTAAGALAALALAVLGVRYVMWASVHEETDDAYLSGHIHPISARVAGTVQQVLVDDNQHVTKGQLLVVLDPADFQVRLDHARSALETALRQAGTAQASIQSTAQTATAQSTQAHAAIGSAQAAITAARAAVTEAEAGVPRARAQWNEAKAKVQREAADLQRYEDLVAKDQVSRQTLDHTRANYEVALAGQAAAEEQVRQAEAQLVAARQGVARSEALLQEAHGKLESAHATTLETGVRREQFSAAQSMIGQARSLLEDAKLQLSYTSIHAPASGRIGKKSVEVGQRIQVGQPLLALVEDSPWVVANFKETQLEKMRDRQPVEVEIDTFPNHPFHGHVDSIAPGSGNAFALLPPDNATGNFTKIVQRIPVKIVLDAASLRGFESLLSPGMSAVVTVETR